MSYTARRTPVHRGPAAWSEILGPGPRYPALDGAQTADIAIVGGGFAGLSAARRALQIDPAARVAIIEAGQIAEGAAGRNSGFMIDLPHDLNSEDYASAGDDAAQIAMNRQAISFAQDAVQDYEIVEDFFDAAGKINGACGAQAEAHNRSYAAHLAALGEPSELLDAAQMREITGSAAYCSGLYTPGTVMLQPAGYVRGLAAGLARRAAIFEKSPVTRIAKTGGGWRLSSKKGALEAGQVILATNGHLESFGIGKGRLIQLFLYASMTEVLDTPPGQGRWGVTPADPMGTTMRRIDGPQGGNRVITRTCASVRTGMVPSPRDLARAARVHADKFAQHFPQLAGARQEHVWAGHLCLSRNGVAICREIEAGLFAACVQNGLGTARGTLTGMAAAELAMGETSALTAHFEAEAAPTKLPPAPFAQIGANAFLRAKEWQARSE
ncbi:MAG: FAD-binding oxidoreductase [Pseudomonadota bacterium]